MHYLGRSLAAWSQNVGCRLVVAGARESFTRDEGSS